MCNNQCGKCNTMKEYHRDMIAELRNKRLEIVRQLHNTDDMLKESLAIVREYDRLEMDC